MAEGGSPCVFLIGKDLCQKAAEAGAGLIGRGALPLFFQFAQPFQTAGGVGGLFRVSGTDGVEGPAQGPGDHQPPELPLVLPVISGGIPGQKDGHVRRVFCVGIAAEGMFFQGVGDAPALPADFVRGLVEAGQEQGQEGGVIIERQLAQPPVIAEEVFAQATIIAAVQVQFPYPQLSFIDPYISEHFLLITSCGARSGPWRGPDSGLPGNEKRDPA